LPKPSIDTLIQDIQKLLVEGKTVDKGRVELFGQTLAKLVADRLQAATEERPKTLRMSNIGKPARQLYYELKTDLPREQLTASTLFKFLYGDLIESIILFLAEEAGHDVSAQQATVELNGIVGHIDAVIDGVVVDVKSASSYSFSKFKDGSLAENDPFGYMDQLAGYATALGGLNGAFLAADKTLGHLTLLSVPAEDLKALDSSARIDHLREVLESDELPDKCYPPEEEGKSGNLKLGVNCSYCAFKKTCWADANDGFGLRTFLYSKGPVHFVNVAKEPLVAELTF